MPLLPGPLVSAAWLSEHLGEVTVVDVRSYFDGKSGRGAYADGHIEGAVFCDLDDDLADPPAESGGRHPLPSPGRFATTMSRLGIGDDSSVVVYDAASGMVAGRLWWMLDSLGIDAAVLDGGLPAWDAPLVPEASVPDVASFSAKPWPAERFVTADEVAARPDATVLVDARSKQRYAGESSVLDPRSGHIPGAKSIEWAGNIAVRGIFMPPEALAERYGRSGIDADTDVIAYCGSGVSACNDLLALRLMGNNNAKLYVGSWSEWGADTDRPLETG